ncbi:MAG TPA: nucleotidyltransferase domain-containing protein [Gemmatimonadaceae bacterium]|nr:nucleotidyltransferase domain-containing protein [Gemmatimonadaceae bacterium]
MRSSHGSSIHQPLDEVLGTRALVRVLRVLVAHGGALAIGDIARRSRLTLPSVRTAIRRLLALDLATGIGAGRSMVCSLRSEHPLAPALAQLFRAEQEQAAALMRALRDAAKQLAPAPWAVWLYGSVARGEDHAASDIDIALVTAAKHPGDQADALRDAVSRAGVTGADRVSVITMRPEDVRRAARARTPFWRNVTRDAVVLAGGAPADVLERASRRRTR